MRCACRRPRRQRPLWHLCLDCVAKEIGRPLTLRDLDVTVYLRTTQHNTRAFMRQYAQATVLGLQGHVYTQADRVEDPTTQPHLALTIGGQLARQTEYPDAALSAPCKRSIAASRRSDQRVAE